MNKLPNKFEFQVRNYGHTYVMARHPEDGEYYCYSLSEDTSEPSSARWNSEAVKNNVKDSTWIITKNLDEQELVFPFTYGGIEGPGSFRVEKDKDGNTWWFDLQYNESLTPPNLYSDEEIKASIKSGHWIVKSVGPQKPVEDPWLNEFCSGEVSHAEDNQPEWAKWLQKTCVKKPSNTDVGKLTIEVNTTQVEQAIEALNRLAEAAKSAKVAIDSIGNTIGVK